MPKALLVAMACTAPYNRVDCGRAAASSSLDISPLWFSDNLVLQGAKRKFTPRNGLCLSSSLLVTCSILHIDCRRS